MIAESEKCLTNKKLPLIVKTYENGSYFKYSELQRRLLNLFETLPLDRLGNLGIYFQEEDCTHVLKLKLLENNQINNNKLLKIIKPNIYSPKKTIQFIPPINKMFILSQRNEINTHRKPFTQDSHTITNSDSKVKNTTLKLMNYRSKIGVSRLCYKLNNDKLPEIIPVQNAHSSHCIKKNKKIIKYFQANSHLFYL